MSIYEALNGVMKDVKAVGKGERNQAQGFQFRGIDGVLNAVGPALRSHGVVVAPEVVSVERSTVHVGKNQTPMGHVMVTVKYRWYGPDGDSIESVVIGESFDAGDKAAAKAMSVAFRTAMLQTLALPTDEPDPDHSVYEQVESPAETAKGELREFLTSQGIPLTEAVEKFKALFEGNLSTTQDADQVKQLHDTYLQGATS